MRTIAPIIVGLVLLAPAAVAQGLTEPLERHVGEKAAGATSDPAGFARDHAREEAVVREAQWGVAYGCYAVDYAEEEYGTPDPQLEQCEGYGEALGIEDEPKEEPVAQAVNLTEGPVSEVEALAEDALGTIEEIVEEPTSAIETFAAFLGRAKDAVLRIVGGMALLALQALGAALGVATGLADGSLAAASLGGEALRTAGQATTSATNGGLDAVAAAGAAVSQGLGMASGAIAGAADAVADGAATAARAIGDALGDVLDALRGSDPAEGQRLEPHDVGGFPVSTDDLGLPCVDCVLEGAL